MGPSGPAGNPSPTPKDTQSNSATKKENSGAVHLEGSGHFNTVQLLLSTHNLQPMDGDTPLFGHYSEISPRANTHTHTHTQYQSLAIKKDYSRAVGLETG
jgi:hypothetical protein